MKKLLLLLIGLFIFSATEAQVHTYYQVKTVNTNMGETTKATSLIVKRLIITSKYCYQCDEYGNRERPDAFNMDIYHYKHTDRNGNTVYEGAFGSYVISADKRRFNYYVGSSKRLIIVYDKEKPQFDDIIMY